ncbi:efflux RND transporter periplasmic adaptor subunit [Methylobacterium nigriterrae]|uniref:efflux RND transporter periplasmic adaptor subunit n=1 Tax=Methylobacterium nigriterrae TaxID=3127512 RepID=UPI0030140417
MLAGRGRPSRSWLCAAILPALVLGACNDPEAPPAPEVRPVRVLTVGELAGDETVSLTGTVQAQVEVNLAFRIDGRMVERLVNVGDTVKAGQIVARLDPENERNAVRAARAAVVAAAGQYDEARNNYDRQRQLLAGGWTTRVRYDQALQQQTTTQAQLDGAHAQLSIAEERASYTELAADAAGMVTQRSAEPGEVVRAGQTIVQIARKDGKDAVFDVSAQIKDQAPANPLIAVSLTMDPAITAEGRVREVAPRADPATGTFQVRVGLADPPPQMRLGAAVTGRMRLHRDGEIAVPSTALIGGEGGPAVWIVDPAGMTVALRPIEIARFDQTRILVARGIEPGEIVVTAGVHALRPGQKVRLLGAAS